MLESLEDTRRPHRHLSLTVPIVLAPIERLDVYIHVPSSLLASYHECVAEEVLFDRGTIQFGGASLGTEWSRVF